MILQILVLLVAVSLIAVGIFRNKAAREQQAQGLVWLQAMRTLISHVQRHRGLASGVLAGDVGLHSQLEQMQKQVSRDFQQIALLGEWIGTQQDWNLITQHWARLAGNIALLEVDRCMDQHNRLIKNILVFVDEIANAHYLGESNSDNRGASWREILSLAELIGQVRAIGTVMAAQGNYGDAGLKNRKRIQNVLQEIISRLESPVCQASLTEKAFQEILNFLEFADSRLLQEGSTVSASEFFTDVTVTLEHLYDCFDDQLTRINRRLRS